MTRFLFVFFVLLAGKHADAQNIYAFSITTVKDSVVNLSSYQGKQILIVNTSLSGSRVGQYRQLDSLQQRFKDSGLIIIAIATKAFDNTLTNNNQLLALYNNLNLSYPLSKMMKVNGAQPDPLYEWLTKKIKNGLVDAPVAGDFSKYLIDGYGNFKGVFSGRLEPTHSIVVDALGY